MNFYLYLSDEFSLCQLILIVRSYVVLLHYCPRLGEGWDPANMFNTATIFVNVNFRSQEPVIHWLSFVDVKHICFSFIILYIHKSVNFLF